MIKSSNISVSEQILKKFADLIQVFGIKHITIDMIAEKCGISKKTVYKYFNSKHDMVAVIINNILDQLGEAMDEIDQSADDVVTKLERLFSSLYSLLGSMSVPMLHDIQTSYPQINGRIEEFIDSHRESIRRNIQLGVESGVFYGDINSDIATDIAMKAAENLLSSEYVLKNNITIEQAITSLKIFMTHALIKI